jgi:signal transduction histidine kinase
MDNLIPFTSTWRWKDGSVALVQAVPNNTDVTLATGWTGSVTDMTAQWQVEQDLRKILDERKAAIVAALEQKRQQELLVDVISHEFRSPVSAILQVSFFVRQMTLSTRHWIES